MLVRFLFLGAASWYCAWQRFWLFASVRLSLFALLVNSSRFLFFASMRFLFFASLRLSIGFFLSASCFWACFLLMPCPLGFLSFAFSFLCPVFFAFRFRSPLSSCCSLSSASFLERSRDYRKTKKHDITKGKRYGTIEKQRIQNSRTTRQGVKGESKKESKGERKNSIRIDGK